jgi:hypothetical protein
MCLGRAEVSRPVLRSSAANKRRCNSVTVAHLCSNRAATRVNLLKTRERHRKENMRVCSYFANPGTLQKGMMPPLHGGGQGFESPRLHPRIRAFAGRLEDEKADRSQTTPSITPVVHQRTSLSKRPHYGTAAPDVCRVGYAGASVGWKLISLLRSLGVLTTFTCPMPSGFMVKICH